MTGLQTGAVKLATTPTAVTLLRLIAVPANVRKDARKVRTKRQEGTRKPPVVRLAPASVATTGHRLPETDHHLPETKRGNRKVLETNTPEVIYLAADQKVRKGSTDALTAGAASIIAHN